MKKIFVLLTVSLLFASCGVYKTVDMSRLRTGMTVAEVENMFGSPERVLAFNETRDGIQEVLQYRTSADEIYALEFWNDYLTGYEFLYEDVTYIAPSPPIYIPAPGIRPPHTSRPPGTTKPNPPTTSEPGRPEGGYVSGRPDSSGTTNRPGSTSGSGREEINNNTRPGNTSSGSTRPTNTGSSTTSTNNRQTGNSSDTNTRTSDTNSRSGNTGNSSGSDRETSSGSGRR